MSYEQAPATKMLASHCACCSRPLVDSGSVETGVGPKCRAKHGYGEAQKAANWEKVKAVLKSMSGLEQYLANEDAHKLANVLIYNVAKMQRGEYVQVYTEAIGALGYTLVARRIVQRLNGIIVDREGKVLVVRGPYNANLNIRRIPRAAYSSRRGVRFTAPVEYARKVWKALCFGYSEGTLVIGEKGVRRTVDMRG